MADEDLKSKILADVKEKDVKLVNLQFTDILGHLKNVVIPAEQLEESIDHGTWFDGSSIEGFARIQESDMRLVPDLSTYTLIPWVSKGHETARIMCDVFEPDGKPYEGCPRYILKKQLEKAKDLGYIFNTGPELEFFLFTTDDTGKPLLVPHDGAGYFDHGPRDLALSIRREICYALRDQGITIEMSHHEVAEGQHEIDFRYSDALTVADWSQIFKNTVKSVAHIHGLYATFMPKPIFGINGSGMHIHQSLFTLDGNTAFFDENGPGKLSKLALSYVAGQLKHIRSLNAVINPTVNSYKRLTPGYEAPVYACWGTRNRSALIRVPRYTPGREKATRVELRCPDPTANPYLAFALLLASGLDGVKNNMEVPEEATDSLYALSPAEVAAKGIQTLPASLEEALNEFEKSELVKETLGEHIFTKYLEAKRQEWDDYRLHVTDWEINRYLGQY